MSKLRNYLDVALFGKVRTSCMGLCHSPISWWDCILFTKSFATAQSWQKIANILKELQILEKPAKGNKTPRLPHQRNIQKDFELITPWIFGSICDDVTVVLQCSGGICNSVTVWMFVSVCYGGAAFPTRNWQFVSIFTPLDCYLALSSHRMRIKKTIFLPPCGNNPS